VQPFSDGQYVGIKICSPLNTLMPGHDPSHQNKNKFFLPKWSPPHDPSFCSTWSVVSVTILHNLNNCIVRFEVLMALIVWSITLCDMWWCVAWYQYTSVSEEHTASIFTVQEWATWSWAEASHYCETLLYCSVTSHKTVMVFFKLIGLPGWL